MASSSPLAIPDRIQKANRRFLDARRGLTPEIVAADSGLETARALREATDRWLCMLWQEALPQRFEQTVSLYATGGYGRDELALHSDIDVLIAVGDPEVARDSDFALAVERMMAWSRQTRVSVSHAVRTPEQARRALDDELRTAVALLDLRHLHGPDQPDPVFGRDRAVDYLRADSQGRDFAADLVDSMRRRAARNGQTVYLLEPDVKNGEGGLRDLNCIGWAARVRWQFDVRRHTDPSTGWTTDAQNHYRRRLDELLALRNRLHLLRGRCHDRLNFREQEALVHLDGADRPNDADDVDELVDDALSAARTPGDPDDRLHQRIETMMRHYYRRARGVATDSERLLRRWAADRRDDRRREGRFAICGERLELADEADLDDETIFELLETAGRHDLLLDPTLERRLEDRVADWPTGDDVSPRLAGELRRLLVDVDQPRRTSRRLVDLGVLTRVVPEFRPLICHVHHDLYHVYTTDVHSRKCLEAGRRLLATDPGDHPRPAFARIGAEIRQTRPFLLACLFHDIGKNRGGDHSRRGASMMESVGPRLGLDDDETERLAFLVRHHLDLSNTSRRRDISDPEIIAELADRIGSLECLHQLTALTYCDMTTVGPDVMNDWNASLLMELFGRLRRALVMSVPAAAPGAGTASGDLDAIRETLAGAVDDHLDVDAASPDDLDRFVDDVPTDHLRDTDPAAMARQFDTYRRAVGADDDVATTTTPLPERSVTEVVVSGPDRPGTLARLAGAIASVGLNIMTADIVTTDGDRTLDIFLIAHFNPRAVPPSPPRTVDAPRRLRRLEDRITDVLCDRVDIDQKVAQRRDEQRLDPRPVPSVGTEVTVDRQASSRYTVLEVRAPDRLGLLYSITNTLHDCRVDTRVSRVDSLGHQAIDTFYCSEFDATSLSLQRIREVVDALDSTLEDDDP